MKPSRRKIISSLLLSLAPGSLARAADLPICVDAAAGEFCLVALPDTQRYASTYPRILRAQLRWVRDSAAALNTRAVVHVGDITDYDSTPEWALADADFELLDGTVPYLVVPGNHDFNIPLRDMGIKTNSEFNAVFSPYRFGGRPWYGGHYGVSTNNSFIFFEGGGQKYLVLGLEFGPSDAVLDWAARVIKKHKDEYRVILVTHAYLNNDSTRIGPNTPDDGPHKMNPAWNDGEEIWQKLVRRQANIDFVLCGHVLGKGTGLLISKTDKGTPVVQMLANYQMQEFGGGGWLRILRFRPRDKAVDVFTYSPWYGRLRSEPDQQFTVAVPWMFQGFQVPRAQAAPQGAQR